MIAQHLPIVGETVRRIILRHLALSFHPEPENDNAPLGSGHQHLDDTTELSTSR